MPIILPEELLGWLCEKELFPQVPASELKRFWDNARAKQIPWASGVSSDSVHPLYLWADDAQYNERGGKLIVVVLGHALDENTNSLFSCFPLLVLRHDP